MDLKNVNSVYFVGIGGIGMSALARYFHHNGYLVAGYDRTETKLTKELQAEGIRVLFQDEVTLIPESFLNKEKTLIVYTPAIPQTHQQLSYFFKQSFEVKKRAQVLGMLTREFKGICVAGTHGKTTTSTLVAHLLKQSKVDCSAFLGGIAQNYMTNLLVSEHSDYVVLEADEYDRSFLQLTPYMALITAADADHLDIYGTDDEVKASFKEFASLTKSDGKLLVNQKASSLFEEYNPNQKYTYALEDKDADIAAQNIRLVDGIYHFDLRFIDEVYADFEMGIPGLVNVENAVGALGLALFAGAEANELRGALKSFKGIRRRFEYRIKNDDLVLIDDYAHHPEEINATVKSVRDLYPESKITGIFQPHLYSRTKDFYKEFASSLNAVDELIMLDIYPAREEPIPGVNSKMILDLVDLPVKLIATKEELCERLKALKPEVVLAMGAGDIDKEIDLLTQKLRSE